MFTEEQKAWMLEAEKRGVLNAEQKNYLAEARKRGLIETKPADYKESLEPFKGDFLPVSRDEYGGPVNFDSDAGIVGSLKRAVSAPYDAMQGKFDPLSEEGQARALEAASWMTPMSAASRVNGGALARKGSFKEVAQKAPTRKALQEATDAGYAQARAMGAEFKPQAIAAWADDMARALEKEGRIAENYPEVHRLLAKLKTPPADAKSISLESMEGARRELGRLAGSPDTAKASAATVVQRGLDDFLETLDPSAVVAGTASPEKAAQTLKSARGNAAAGFRSDRVTNREYFSDLETKAANSGRNTDNKIRQNLVSLLKNRKESRGISDAERKAIEDIINGRPSKNAARYLGNLLGGGGGLGSAFLSAATGVGGASAFGPGGAALAAIPPVVGATARGIANSMSKKELKALDDLIRSRSPLAKSMPKQGPVYQPGLLQGATETYLKGLLSPREKPKPAGLLDFGWI